MDLVTAMAGLSLKFWPWFSSPEDTAWWFKNEMLTLSWAIVNMRPVTSYTNTLIFIRQAHQSFGHGLNKFNCALSNHFSFEISDKGYKDTYFRMCQFSNTVTLWEDLASSSCSFGRQSWKTLCVPTSGSSAKDWETETIVSLQKDKDS